MKLETLYKRTKTGAIQFWEISVNQSPASIIKFSGQLGTDKPLRHEEVIKKGKNIGKANETSPYEQAWSQASSDLRKKQDEGYKSLKDLGIEDHDERWSILSDVLEKALPQFNSDAQGNIKPMLAKDWKGGKGIKFPTLLETKFDGVRSLLITNESDCLFLSRSGKEYTTLSHIQRDILGAYSDGSVEDNFVLDGEIYCHGMTLEEINEAVKKQRPETLNLQYWVYDLPLHPGTQEERSAALSELVKQIDSDKIIHVPSAIVNSIEQVKKFHDLFVQDGFEGAMIKDPKGTYQQGQRSSFWRKVKEFDDTEFTVIGHKLGQRGAEDLIFTCECPAGTFDVKMSGTLESKKKLYDRVLNDEIVGKSLTVKHFGYSKYEIPNLPVGKAIRENN